MDSAEAALHNRRYRIRLLEYVAKRARHARIDAQETLTTPVVRAIWLSACTLRRAERLMFFLRDLAFNCCLYTIRASAFSCCFVIWKIWKVRVLCLLSLFYNTQGNFIKVFISYAKSRYVGFFSTSNFNAPRYCHEFVRLFTRQRFERKKDKRG